MNTRMNKTTSLLATFLLGVVLAASSNAGAAAPWFKPGGVVLVPVPVPVPKGGHAGDRGRDRGRGENRRLYSEQRFIRHLYQGFLNRQPTADELRTWTDRLGRDATPTELVRDFLESDEFFIRQTYLGLLGREPDRPGMNTYMGVLREGRSRADVVESILASDEFRNRLR